MKLARRESPAIPHQSSESKLWFLVLAISVFATAVLVIQLNAGAYTSEFGSHSDEAAHFVTGLFVYDYATAPTADVRGFADTFYSHYPKVGLGHWPPLFYVLQALWYLPFGASPTAALTLMCILSAAVATMTAALFRVYVNPRYAVPAGIFLLATPHMQRFSASVMTEVLVSLLTLSASVAYASYLKGTRPVCSALVFGCLASGAIMTKGSGLLLAFLPLIAVIIDRKYSRLFTIAFWLPAAVVVVCCSPFYLYTLDLQRNGMLHESFSAGFIRQSLPYYTIAFAGSVGGGATAGLAALSGLRIAFSSANSAALGEDARSLWTSISALLGSVLLFCYLVPCGLEERHLIPAIPPAILLAGRLLFALIAVSDVRWRRVCILSRVAAALLVALDASSMRLYVKDWHGFREIVSLIHRDSEASCPVSLVVSDPRGDGMFVSEAAASETRPGMFALRASKVLGSDKWDGRRYTPRYGSTAEVAAVLDELGVDFVVYDDSIERDQRVSHYEQIRDVLVSQHPCWTEIARFDAVRNGHRHPGGVRVFRRVRRERPSSDPSTIERAVIAIQGSKTGRKETRAATPNAQSSDGPPLAW